MPTYSHAQPIVLALSKSRIASKYFVRILHRKEQSKEMLQATCIVTPLVSDNCSR